MGIGYACAQCLGKEGAAVIVADVDDEGARRAAQQLQDQQIAASAFKCDVGNKSEVRCSPFGITLNHREEINFPRM